ncbi:MAG: hypothetical protein NZ898_16820 [Myxococcota bacterium]|nr:hypothetical protein [Myxococcota bacterium]MDW8360938.1 hypothetical protein [Myxococcales bacterium]
MAPRVAAGVGMSRLGRALAVLAAAIGATGCGAGTTARQAPPVDATDPRVLYPLARGHVWSYDIDTGTGTPTLSVTRVVRDDGRRVEVSNNGGPPVVYERRPQGLHRVASDTWLLRAPVRRGERWPAPGGMTAEVTADGLRVEVPAGRFEGCVRVEERGGEEGRHIRTTYCPHVGPVIVESELALATSPEPVRVRARLLGWSFDSDAP